LSRIGKKPIAIPTGVEVKLEDGRIDVRGPKGSLSLEYLHNVRFERDGDLLRVVNIGDRKENRKFHGLYRTLVANMVHGVTEGFTKRLEIHGQGYKAAVQGRKLELHLGFSHPVIMEIPEGMEVKVEEKRGEKMILIDIRGIDKQAVGQFAANIRALRKPEPYKGKGIRYADEYVRRKQGKKTVS
jgi:large subunit ribosomal protein L6